ncbi:MAG: BatD family protein, partial [Granulosicoccus sp.]|nr:BatD family protein [Granulosicoccus sp.]
MPSNLGKAISSMPQILWFLVLMWFQFPVWAQQAYVKSELSASTITRDETVVLNITAVGIDAELDASSLEQDFEVLGRSSTREVRTVSGGNNQISNISVVSWSLELLPKSVGVFTVPSVKVGDLRTQLLTLTVNDTPQGAQRDIFVEASVDRTDPWVQSQVLLTVKVFQAIDIIDGDLDIPAIDNLVVQRIGDDTRTRQERDGREYSVTERRYALFAQKSGLLNLKPVTLSVTVPADPNRVRGFFAPTRKLTSRSAPISLNVRPRPDTGSAWWLPAKALRLESQWASPPEEARVDQPLTRTIVMRVDGIQDSQLPEIETPSIDGISLYAEQPQRETGATADSLVAEQRVNWALIPHRSGEIVLPAISIEWFNTQTGQTETAHLPEERINVLSATAGSDAGTSAGLSTESGRGDDRDTDQVLAGLEDQASDLLQRAEEPSTVEDAIPKLNHNTADQLVTGLDAGELSAEVFELKQTMLNWRRIALFALGLWFATALYWAWQRWSFGADSTQSGKSLFGAVKGGNLAELSTKAMPLSNVEAACKQGDHKVLKQALIDWAARQWPGDSTATLQTIAQRLPEGAARQSIRDLDNALYGQKHNDVSEVF